MLPEDILEHFTPKILLLGEKAEIVPLRQAAARGGRPYEFRPQQIEMSGAIADALAAGSNLCVEAPTGVGKSFAYLIPLIYRSRSSGRPAIISTETINLQEQLIDKDIPLLRELTGVDFRAALAKGRHNYLCRRRLSLLSGEERDALLPAPSLALDLDRIGKWLERGADGDRDSIDFRIEPATWNLVCCEAGNCLSKKCPFFRNCCYFRARQEWECADIVVANHALFFTDLAMRCAGGNAGGPGQQIAPRRLAAAGGQGQQQDTGQRRCDDPSHVQGTSRRMSLHPMGGAEKICLISARPASGPPPGSGRPPARPRRA